MNCLISEQIILFQSDIPDEKEPDIKQFLKSFESTFLRYIDTGEWKLVASSLSQEKREVRGEKHTELTKVGDEIEATLTRYVIKNLKRKKLPTVDVSVNLALSDYVSKAFLDHGK